jgi:GTP-binding protein HflX
VTRPYHTLPENLPHERAYLVGVTLPGGSREDELENLRELELLARSAAAEVVGRTVQSRTRIDGSTYIGAGKLEEIARTIYTEKINLVIFDDDLSPAQARNIEKRLEVNVVDRTEVILDIFARRARTRQARIQVEIAQLTYALPRLRRLWEHLSRQAGGIGTRGPGETQLEVDRRRVREKIAHLKRELKRIDRGTAERRKRRRDVFRATIVGYTNAGKSTLLNGITGSGVLESARLFSTLDSTTRRVTLPGGAPALLTDTIGFIRKLPPHLVASFRATLMDVREADLLIHVVDASSPRYEDSIAVVHSVLEGVLRDGAKRGAGPRNATAADAGADAIPTILVLNKVDLLTDRAAGIALQRTHPDAVLVSAALGEGFADLLAAIETHRERDTVAAEVLVPTDDGKSIAAVEKSAHILNRRIVDGRLHFDVNVRKRDIALLERVGEVRLKPLRPQ